MSQRQSSPVLRFLRRLRSTPAAGGDSDSALLDRFVNTRNEDAFVALVERHGGMVLSVCRRVLQNLHDAEDAFQATFLVLARRAGSIRRRASLASWLYGVAFRVARKAQTAKVGRRARERRAADDRPEQMSPDDAWRELRTILDDELNLLPEKYRAPLVLCYLEGKTNEQAAQQLGWTKGTVSGRMARARDLLRARLTRRGLTLSAGTLVGLLGAGTAPAAVPGTLLDATIRAATAFAAGKTVAAPTAAVLAEGVMRAMFISKCKVVLAVTLSLVLTGGGASLLARALTAAARDTETASAAVTVNGKGGDDAMTIQGVWKLMSQETDGQLAPAEAIKDMSLEISARGDWRLSFGPGKPINQALVVTDPSQKPAVMDVRGTKGRVLYAGLYKVEGDTMTICRPTYPGGPRPKELKSSAEHLLWVWQRVGKTSDEQTPLVGDAADKPAERTPVQRAADTELSQNQLKEIHLAMLGYYDQKFRLPAAAIYDKDGKPLLSWRVAILPFLDGLPALYKQFKLDEPWDSEHNKKLIPQMPKTYAAPGIKTKSPGMTFYRVFVGPGTVFEPRPETAGSKPTVGRTLPEVRNTIFVVEAGDAVPWTKPEEMQYDAKKPLPNLGGIFGGDFNILLNDTSTRFVRRGFNERLFRDLITINHGRTPSPDELNR